MASQVIVVGGGLSGLSAAHTVLERGGNVLLLDKNSFMGGNSTKATSGINGALTNTQISLGVPVSRFTIEREWVFSLPSSSSSSPEKSSKQLGYKRLLYFLPY